MSKSSVRYLVFDVESVADPVLVKKMRYPKLDIEPAEAVTKYRGELMSKFDSDFIPYTFQVPVSVVVAKGPVTAGSAAGQAPTVHAVPAPPSDPVAVPPPAPVALPA